MKKELKDFIDLCNRNNVPKKDAVKLWDDLHKSNGISYDRKELDLIRSGVSDKSINPAGTDYGNSSDNSGSSFVSSTLGTIGSIVSASDTKYQPDISEERAGFDYDKILLDSKGNLNELSVIGKNLISATFEAAKNQGLLYFKQQSALLDGINRELNMTGEFAARFREELTNANPRLLQLGIGFSDLVYAAQKLIDTSGKFATINQQTWERAGEVAKAYVGSLEGLVVMYPEFEKVGLGAADAQERIAKAGKDALNVGLQSKKTVAELSQSISKINEYGFKNGIEGLSQMVRKATEFRMSMGEVFKIADKVFSPEGAVELSANLQVLGGAIGDFNDPLKLMYMATNNVEGLQDALIGAASSLSTYNSEQGRFEITGVNLRRAKEMAVQLGISYDELSKGAIAAAERSKASTDLMARGLELNKDQKEFLTNISQMKGGRMVIELNTDELKKQFGANEVALDTLTQEQANNLIRMQDEFKGMSENDIVRQQATDIGNMRRDVDYMVALARKTGGRTAENLYNDIFKVLSDGKMKSSDMAKATYEYAKDFRAKVENKEFKNLEDLGKTLTNSLGIGYKKEKSETPTGTTTTTPKPESTPVTSTKPPEPDVTKIKSDIDGLMASVQNKAIGLLNTNILDMVGLNSTMAKNTTDSNKFLGSIDNNMSNLYKLMQGQQNQSQTIAKTDLKNQEIKTNTNDKKDLNELIAFNSSMVKNTTDSNRYLGSIDNNMSNLYRNVSEPKPKPTFANTSNLNNQTPQNANAIFASRRTEDLNKSIKENNAEPTTSKYAKMDVNITHTFNGPVIYDTVKNALLRDPEFTNYFVRKYTGDFVDSPIQNSKNSIA